MTTSTDTAEQAGRRTLTVNEVALMRAIVEWRRETDGSRGPWPRVDCYRRTWKTGLDGDYRQVSVDFPRVDDPADGYAEVGFYRGRYASLTFFRASTLAEGVDVLVAFGYLPVRFSPAYRAGWDAGREDGWQDVIDFLDSTS